MSDRRTRSPAVSPRHDRTDSRRDDASPHRGRAATLRRHRTSSGRDRASSAVVGAVLLVGLTVLLAGSAFALVAFGQATTGDAPRAHLSASLSATDGWPDGQRLRVRHEAGDTLAVADLAVVVEVRRTGERARVGGLPTRRLTGDHVSGADLFDRTYAGIDGELDAAHTDGRWESGETASLRIAQGELDVEPGDRVVALVVHRPSGARIARTEVRAS